MSSRLWLARRMVFPSSFSFKNSCRISCTPWLSRPFIGSSRIRREGSSIIACAIPRRWRMPSEYLPTCFFASGSSPTFRMAASISFFPIFLRMPARNCRFCLALYPGRKPGVSMMAPILSGASISFPICFPSTKTAPSSTRRNPQMHLNRTVLPLPFLPIIP